MVNSAISAANYDATDKRWSKMGTHMNQFHEYFRHEFRQIYSLADCYESKGRMTLSEFLQTAEGLHSRAQQGDNLAFKG